jgi:hypothetical protein
VATVFSRARDLQAIGRAAYSLSLDRPNLSGLLLAPIVDLPDEAGSLGIELVTPDGQTAASARIPLSEIDQHHPARSEFPPVPASRPSVVLRVDVRDMTTPVRLFECCRYRFLGLGRLATRPFCAFIYE